MGDQKKKQKESFVELNVGWWTKWGMPYLFATIWLVFVMLFAYLSIVVDYYLTEEPIPFFDVYSKLQSNYLAAVANFSFFLFAGLDYLQTHYHYRNYEVQLCVILISIFSLLCIVLLPNTTNYIQENKGIIISRGTSYSITWICYTMHCVYLFSLLVLRGETQKVRSIEEYANTYINNPY